MLPKETQSSELHTHTQSEELTKVFHENGNKTKTGIAKFIADKLRP